jgi:hypothetical protein
MKDIFSIMNFEVNDLIYYANYFWFIQIFICLIYCLLSKRYVPNQLLLVKSNHILIKQLNFYFISQMLLYLIEIIKYNIIITQFERFLHHVCAILLFASTVYEPVLICVNYLLPTFVHSIYWCLYKRIRYSYYILMIYNLLLFIAACLFLNNWKNNLISIRIPLFGAILFNVNLMGHFYDYEINFNHLDGEKFIKAIIFSFILTLPIYFYIIYFWLKKKSLIKYQKISLLNWNDV